MRHDTDGAPVATLRGLAARWLAEQHGSDADLAALLTRGYDDAPPCVAALR